MGRVASGELAPRRVPPRAGLIALLALGLLQPPAVLGGKLTDKEHTHIEEPRPADVPSDAELEAAGARIGEIEIDPRNIFERGDPRENSGLYRLADQLHKRTRASAVRSQLLFKSGDPYRARVLAETERNLRKLVFIYDARVVPVHYAAGKVDIRVITRDVWTLSPGVSIGRAGGANSVSYDLREENLLGRGKDLEVARTSNVDRTSNTLTYNDPNVWGSHWTGAAAYSDSTDGYQRSLQIGQPFYALDTRWSTKLTALGYDRTISRYALGNIADQFNDDESTFELSGGISGGLVDGWSRRLLFGVHYDRNDFVPTPSSTLPAKPLPADRTLSYPFVGFDVVQEDFERIGDENQIGKTEDLYFGTEVTGQLGLSDHAFGANRDAPLLALTAVHGLRLPDAQQLFLSGDFSTRIEQGRARNLVSDLAAKYYWRWHEDWLLYGALSGTVTDALDPDMQLLLGGDNGLRGYPLRYESGTSRALLTIEQRVFTDWYPFRLVRLGAAAFCDVGRTWGSGIVGNSDAGLLSDVGVGLRLGNTRSGLGNVLHIDLAVPLKSVPNATHLQFLVQTFQSF